MSDDKEKEIEAIFNSMKDSKRAKPSPELYGKIHKQIFTRSTKVISITQLKKYAAAACFILLLNTIALYSYNLQKGTAEQDVAAVDNYQESLITSYEIYE